MMGRLLRLIYSLIIILAETEQGWDLIVPAADMGGGFFGLEKWFL